MEASERVAAIQTIAGQVRVWQQQGASRALVMYELCRALVEQGGYETARIESLREPPVFAAIVYTRSRSCVDCLGRFALSEQGTQIRQALVLDANDLPRLARPHPDCLMAMVEWRCQHDHLALSVCFHAGQPNADELAALRRVLALSCLEETPEQGMPFNPEPVIHLSGWMPHGLFAIAGEEVVFVNQTLAHYLGYSSAENFRSTHRKITDLLRPEDHTIWRDFVKALREGPLHHSIERRFHLCRADGTSWDALLRCATSPETPDMVTCSVLDSAMPANETITVMETMSRAVQVLSRARSFDEAVHEITRQVKWLVPANAANVFLVQQGRVFLVAGDGYNELGIPLDTIVPMMDVDTFPTFRYMLETREPILIEDTQQSGWWKTLPHTEAVRSYIGVPLVARGEVSGFLNVDGVRPHQFTLQDVQRLRLFAAYAAAMVEQLRLVETLAAERNRFELLYNVALSLSASLDMETVGARALELLQEAFGALNVIIYLWDESDRVLRPLCGHSKLHTMQLDNIVPTFKSTQRGLALWVFETGQPALVGDVAQNPHWVYVPGVDDWVHAALDVPLVAHGHTIGVLSLLAEQPNAFDEHDLRLLEVISIPMALALQNARFYQQAEQRAQAMAEALQQKEELERVKQKVIQDVAHELRTPVAIIQGYTEALLEQMMGALEPEQARVLDIIQRRAHMLDDLIKGMMVLWQAQEQAPGVTLAHFEELNFTALVREVVEDFQVQAQKAGLMLLSALAPTELWVVGDALLLRRVVDNLISNALKFTPSGRKVVVSLEMAEDTVVLEVCDEGIGIPADKLNLVFERFYRIEDARLKRKGLGLGLALVKAIVEMHGGTVCALSPVFQDAEYPGTCMRVTLKRVDPGGNAGEVATTDGGRNA